MSKPMFKNRDQALVIGYVGVILGTYALYEAYDMVGRRRPFWTKFIPGA